MAQLRPVDGTDVYLWKYLPLISAAIIFLSLFTTITSVHCWRMIKTRSWFCIPFAIGGLFQVIGYSTRIYAHYHTNQIATYVIQSTTILTAPVFYAATIYMVLGRIIRSVHGERFSIIHRTRLTKLYVLGDILALNVQGNGAGLAAKTGTIQEIGKYIVVGGLVMQLALFGLFVFTAVVFHRRLRRHVIKESASDLRLEVPWEQGLWMLYSCSALITVRSIFRVIEYLMGTDGYLLSHEWVTYVFDATLMWIVQVIFFICFPDKLGVKQDKIGDDDGHVLVENGLPMR